MSVVSLVILLVNAVVVLVGVVAAAEAPDTGGALAMVGGATVLVAAPHHAVVCHHPAEIIIAGHQHIVDERSCHMQTEMGLRTGVVAEADHHGGQLFNCTGICYLC